jgi:hypothetical protein
VGCGDYARLHIGKKNHATVGTCDTKTQTRLCCHQSIAARAFGKLFCHDQRIRRMGLVWDQETKGINLKMLRHPAAVFRDGHRIIL